MNNIGYQINIKLNQDFKNTLVAKNLIWVCWGTTLLDKQKLKFNGKLSWLLPLILN